MKINGIDFTIGADPEVFVQDKGKFISAHNLVEGTKEQPFVVNNGAVQVDGLALEFNIDPASDFKTFYGNMESVKNTLSNMIGDKEFLNKVSVEFDEDFIKNIPEFNLMLGCESDYNGWTGEENIPPDGDNLMRTAGGHVHIGGFFSDDPFSKEHFYTCAKMSRILDYTLGVYSILWDKDDKRREMYGQAGCFRPKKYGMEYRTMSNKWIFDKKLCKFVYDSVERAITLMFNNDFNPDEEVRKIINTSDRDNNFFKGNNFCKGLLI